MHTCDMSVTNLQGLRGMADLLPEQVTRWQAVESLAREHFKRGGVHEIRTPLLESTDLFTRGIGEATDVVGKEMYSFFDRGRRSCTLRPEGTASVVRSALQHNLLHQGGRKFWYSGPMFRYERPQAGRQRQFHQIGVEFLGFGSARSDVEAIILAIDFLSSLGIHGLELQINSLGSFEDRQLYRSCLVSWLKDRFDDLDSDSQQRLFTNPLRILDSKNPDMQSLLSDAPTLVDSLCDESSNRFLDVQEFLSASQIPFKVNRKLVRGLDYYCHTAFEITSNQLGAQSTVCGGGRYDGLVEQLGGKPTPAIGWALGLERLLLLIDSAAKSDANGIASQLIVDSAPDVYVVNRGVQAQSLALALTRNLRKAGLSVELDDSNSAFGKQFKRADRCQANWAIIIGDLEAQDSSVRLKSLRCDSDDQLFPLKDFPSLLKVIGHGPNFSS